MTGSASTKLLASDLQEPIISICIIIANREVRDCAGGIGFRCGFVVCPGESAISSQQNGIKFDRTYKARLTRDNKTQKTTLTFLEPVNWTWIENS